MTRAHTHTHLLSLKESRRNSGVSFGHCGRQTGSLCIAGHTLTKLPQSVPTQWKETLRLRAWRGTAGVCGCVHARTDMTPVDPDVAQTLHCAASTPSALIPPLRTFDVESHGWPFWCSLEQLKKTGKQNHVFTPHPVDVSDKVVT